MWFQTSSCIISTDIERSQLPANNQTDSQSTVVFVLFVFSDLSMDQKIQLKEYIVKVLFFLDFDAFLRGSKKL